MAESVATSRSLSDLVKALHDEVAELRASNQRLLSTSSANSSQERTSRVDVQPSAKYNGSRDARAIDNFLFQVDYYLDLQNVVEENLKIKTTAMLLEGDVVAWWRRKIFYVENGHCTIQTFDDFRRELKGYFMLVDAERQTYRMVANLRQTGLQPWAQADMERSNPKTLKQAYVAAERLADTQRISYTETFKSTREFDHNEARPIYAVVRDAVVKIEGWMGRANFSVVQTDDFQIILGMEFLRAAKMVPMSHLRSVSILDERHPCMVQQCQQGKINVRPWWQHPRNIAGRTKTLAGASLNETSPHSEHRRPNKQ
ncbi:hypothetical protein EJ110_NYTH18382 [Nymphaea thermarum]|nr:hypothetical protein EJ110_NYTH18382 [Nymphaea thermarum]